MNTDLEQNQVMLINIKQFFEFSKRTYKWTFMR